MNVTARVQRDGNWWFIEIPEVPGVFTQARDLEEVPAMAADAVAVTLDIDTADVRVTVHAVRADQEALPD